MECICGWDILPALLRSGLDDLGLILAGRHPTRFQQGDFENSEERAEAQAACQRRCRPPTVFIITPALVHRIAMATIGTYQNPRLCCKK